MGSGTDFGAFQYTVLVCLTVSVALSFLILKANGETYFLGTLRRLKERRPTKPLRGTKDLPNK